jgi:tetratricopeptide (TPR) repeat protein
VRSGNAKFKQWRHFTTSGALLVLLAGCVSTPPRAQQTQPAEKQPLGSMTVATPDADHDLSALLMQGQFAVHKGHLKVAQKAYARASMLSNDPKVAEHAVGLALAVHDSAAAEAAVQRWQTLGGDKLGLLRARAQIALDQGKTDAAKALMLELTASGSARGWKNFGRVLMNARDAAQAGHLLEAVATPARLPNDQNAWLAMSELGQKLGRYAYANKLADAAIQRFHSADTYAWSAGLHAERGDNAKALSLYAKAVKTAPDDTSVRLAYAGLLARSGRGKDARHVLAQGAQDENTYAARAAFAARDKDVSALRGLYDEVRHAPAAIRDQSGYLLGQLASLLDKPEAAVDWFAKVPADDPHGLQAGTQRAVLLQGLGHSVQAHALVGRLLDELGDQPKAVARLQRLDAELYMRDRDYTHAITAYTRALHGASDNKALLYGRGLAYAEAGRIDAAVADFRHVLKLAPDDIDAANALGYTLADADRDLEEAGKWIGKARAARPDDPAINDSWGWLQYRLGHLDRAEQVLQHAWSQRKDPEVGAHLVQVLLAQGKKKQARQVYAAALHLDPGNTRLHALKGKL